MADPTRGPRHLTGYHRDILVDGPPNNMPLHVAALTIAHAARRVGWSYSDYHQAMTDPTHGLASSLTRWHGVPRRLRGWWSLAHNGTSRDPMEVCRVLAGYRAEADAMPWVSRGGSTERLVYEGVLVICGDRGVFATTVSVRDLEIVTTINDRTCGKALARLEKKGMINRPYRGDGGYAAKIQPVSPAYAMKHSRSEGSHLRSPYVVSSANSQNTVPGNGGNWENTDAAFCPTLSLRQIMNSDIMAVLNPSTVRVLNLVSSGPQPSARSMALRLGMGTGTCCRSLELLASLGLASHYFGVWQPAGGLRERVARIASEHVGFRAAIEAKINAERSAFAAARHYGKVRSDGAVGWSADGQAFDVRTGEVIAMPVLGPRPGSLTALPGADTSDDLVGIS